MKTEDTFGTIEVSISGTAFWGRVPASRGAHRRFWRRAEHIWAPPVELHCHDPEYGDEQGAFGN